MATWVTADHHFFHANIIKYTNRPFDTVYAMNNALAQFWNVYVQPDDDVYHLGDFGFYTKDPEGIRRLFNSLHGRKYLVPGSHDQHMEELAWEDILSSPHRLYDTVLVHDGNHLLRQAPELVDTPVFCGHVHELWKVQGNMLNVGVDVWHFRPVQFADAKEYLKHHYEYWKAHKDADKREYQKEWD